jgi:L-fuculose-phosphate aldolase
MGIDVYTEDELAEQVAVACRILEAQGQGHSFLGHVSARMPGVDVVKVKPSGMGLGEIRTDDVIEVDFVGRKVAGRHGVHAEMPIHLGIYKRRPDVHAVVHTHPLHVAGLMASSGRLEMVNQDSLYFARGVGHYPSPALVVNEELGDSLADALGDRNAVLMRNHGLVTVGRTVQEGLFLAVALESSLRVQATAAAFGEISPIAGDDLTEMLGHFSQGYDRRVLTTWEYLRRLLPAVD